MSLNDRVLRALPAGVREHPLETSLSVFGVPAGIATGFRLTHSQALSILPAVVVTAWAIVWTVGCVAWFVGLVFSSERDHHGGTVITHVATLVLGLWFVSVASLIYGLAVVYVTGTRGVMTAVFALTIAAGTYVRRIDLQRRIKGDRDWESTEP